MIDRQNVSLTRPSTVQTPECPMIVNGCFIEMPFCYPDHNSLIETENLRDPFALRVCQPLSLIPSDSRQHINVSDLFVNALGSLNCTQGARIFGSACACNEKFLAFELPRTDNCVIHKVMTSQTGTLARAQLGCPKIDVR
jgi:hypothetical protein